MLRWLSKVRRRRYDAIFDLQGNDHTRILLGLLWLSGSRVRYRVGYHRRFTYNVAPPRRRHRLRISSREPPLCRRRRTLRRGLKTGSGNTRGAAATCRGTAGRGGGCRRQLRRVASRLSGGRLSETLGRGPLRRARTTTAKRGHPPPHVARRPRRARGVPANRRRGRPASYQPPWSQMSSTILISNTIIRRFYFRRPLKGYIQQKVL